MTPEESIESSKKLLKVLIKYDITFDILDDKLLEEFTSTLREAFKPPMLTELGRLIESIYEDCLESFKAQSCRAGTLLVSKTDSAIEFSMKPHDNNLKIFLMKDNSQNIHGLKDAMKISKDKFGVKIQVICFRSEELSHQFPFESDCSKPYYQCFEAALDVIVENKSNRTFDSMVDAVSKHIEL